jgi:tetratricopeptide (TPR) repeat protein
MKKSLFTLLTIFFAFGFSSAQEDGLKLAKNAGKALTSYNIDPSGNAAKLGEAKEKIEQALKTPEAQALGTAWMTKGDVYNTLLQKDLARRMIDPKAALTGDNDALVAFDAYKKVYELSVKKYEKADAVKGISEVQPYLINIGVSKYEANEFDKAFLSFKASVESHDILKENAQKSFLDDPKQLEDQIYFTGLIASLANRCTDAVFFYEKLYKTSTTNPAVYEGLYNCKIQLADEAGAATVLAEGRKKFPEDPALLFAEINAYLKAGKLAELTDRLEQALKQEPDNVGLYVTLGNVYDNLYQGALKEKNNAKAGEYFEMAKLNYSKGLLKNPDHLDANYSLGALYFNKAAIRTQDMNALPEDFSSAGLKKMEVIKNEVIALFDLALPYFQKAESVDPNDMNTLIALNEIYARKDDEVLSPAIKTRLDLVKGGGKNASSYFKKN